jgi:WD40 repeat protein
VYHPNGREVISAAWDGTVRIWDAANGRQVDSLPHVLAPHPCAAAVVAPAFWLYGEAVRREPPPNVFSAAVHSNGRLMATLDRKNRLHLWDYPTRTRLHVWAVHSDHWKSGRLAFHPASDLLACGCSDGTVRLFDVRTRKQLDTLTGHKEAVRDVAFSPDGRWLATAGDEPDRTVRVWDAERRVLVKVLDRHRDGVLSLAFSRDGKTLAGGSNDGVVHLWDTADWAWTGQLQHNVRVYGLAFSDDGKRLACGCMDNSIHLWDVGRLEEVAELRGHDDYVHSVAFSPDGFQLVSASGDKTVRIWDATPAKSGWPVE